MHSNRVSKWGGIVWVSSDIMYLTNSKIPCLFAVYDLWNVVINFLKWIDVFLVLVISIPPSPCFPFPTDLISMTSAYFPLLPLGNSMDGLQGFSSLESDSPSGCWLPILHGKINLICTLLTCTWGVHGLWHSLFPKVHCRKLPERNETDRFICGSQLCLKKNWPSSKPTRFPTFAAATAASTSSVDARATCVITCVIPWRCIPKHKCRVSVLEGFNEWLQKIISTYGDSLFLDHEKQEEGNC